ncbi:hypothetical protein BGLA2_60122 [Burkholderia gladioli]|nr:hypothetical protein BGLA2_60122 [Burkholderia gladioli]
MVSHRPPEKIFTRRDGFRGVLRLTETIHAGRTPYERSAPLHRSRDRAEPLRPRRARRRQRPRRSQSLAARPVRAL